MGRITVTVSVSGGADIDVASAFQEELSAALKDELRDRDDDGERAGEFLDDDTVAGLVEDDDRRPDRRTRVRVRAGPGACAECVRNALDEENPRMPQLHANCHCSAYYETVS